MTAPFDSSHHRQPVPLNWSVLPALGICLLLIYLPEARSLADMAAGLIVLTAVVATIGMRLAPKDSVPAEKPGLMVSSCLILFLVGAALTALFWYRAWMALPSVWGARPLMMWIQIIGFWWPGVLFAALCRHAPERIVPASRGRYTTQLWWGAAGSVAGMAIYIVLLGIREGWS